MKNLIVARVMFAVLFLPFFCQRVEAAHGTDSLCRDAERLSVNQIWDDHDAPIAQLETRTTAELVKLLSVHPKIEIPWLLAMYPRKEVRLAGLQIQIKYLEELFKQPRLSLSGTLQERLRDAANREGVITSLTRVPLHMIFEIIRKNKDFDQNIEMVRKYAPLVCAYFPLSGCTSSLREIAELMHPHIYGDVQSVALVDLWESFMTDPRAIRGAALAALRVMARMNDLQFQHHGIVEGESVYTDLLAGYQSAGMSPIEASNYAMTFLGIYATRGASLFPLLGTITTVENHGLSAALAYISSAMSYLDLFVADGGYYSLPAEIRGTCAYGKPYHFWMAAYEVQALEKRGHSTRGSVLASHLTGELYEFGSKTYHRDPDVVYSDDVFDLESDRVRIDLVFNDLGALWAGNSAKSKLDSTQSFVKFRSAARPLREMDDEELKKMLGNPSKKYEAFRTLFAPDVLMH